MSSYHMKTDLETAQMLTLIEAEHPEVVRTYFERFGIDELPLPRLVEGNDRQYHVWQLNPIVSVDPTVQGFTYQSSHVPADRAGYMDAVTMHCVFDAECPEGIYDEYGKRTDQAETGRGRKKSA